MKKRFIEQDESRYQKENETRGELIHDERAI